MNDDRPVPNGGMRYESTHYSKNWVRGIDLRRVMETQAARSPMEWILNEADNLIPNIGTIFWLVMVGVVVVVLRACVR